MKNTGIIILFVMHMLTGCAQNKQSQIIQNPSFRVLTPEEARVIIDKGTERPFTGKYTDFFEDGIYKCKRCGAPLYKSSDKFHSGCGWPSFDDEIKGAIKRVPDADGRRTEIVCARCGAHLGHVFKGEGFTPKNTRHCVNSISLTFEPRHYAKELKTDTAIFAGGCFWGVEYYLQQHAGVLSTDVGYTGGNTKNPSYNDVSHKNTGHAEAVRVIYDPTVISYEELAKYFFEIHDPTQKNRQGPDVGYQYRSAIFYENNHQKMVAEKLIEQLKNKGYKVVTEVVPASKFYMAENYHQDYYMEKNGHPYCHVYTKRF